MRKNKYLALVIASVFLATLWGCGSNMDSGGDQTGAGTTVADASLLGITNCATCHNQGTGVTDDWLSSFHANGNIVPNSTSATCTPCHDRTGDGLLMSAAFAGETNRNVVSCEACHGGGQFHLGVGPLPYPVPGPAQCGECHGIEEAKFHSTSATRLINDTHFDNPSTGFLGTSSNVSIEGYVVKTNNQDGCQVCHFNGHNPTLDINNAWARSAHGGKILDVKDANSTTVGARVAAAVTNAVAPGWSYYNWDQTTGTGNRATCQRCHTSTGIANYLTDPTTYSPTNNDFSHLSGWTAATGSPQNEMLYCWGCHSDNKGSLRNPGAITADYTGANFTYPDVSSSNVCLACHVGRENGGTITARAAISTTDWSNQSFVNSHYLTAGGSVFSASGYHFNALDYQIPPNLHSLIGTDEAFGASAGEAGPCVLCHMSSSGAGLSHSFAVVTKDPTTDMVTDINPSFCTACHLAGSSLDLSADSINAAVEGYSAALTALQAQLALNGFVYQDSHPYFAAKNWGTATTGPHNMGAAFNFNMLKHEPGGYAHNPRYATRLIWDSIDWLDNNTLDNSTVAAVNALTEDIANPFKVAALAYLGVSRP